MDRFIAGYQGHIVDTSFDLKSNMDRFIVVSSFPLSDELSI